MKLNNKRTVLIGFAFLLICAFWQLYDNVITLILKFDLGVDDVWAGAIMALDNVFALFLLPLFGSLSDRTNTRLGKRMPYILVGTLVSAGIAVFLPIAGQTSLPVFMGTLLLALTAMGTFRSPAVSLMPDITPKPLRSKGNAVINLMGAAGGIIVLGLTSVLMKTEYFMTCPFGHRTGGVKQDVVSYLCEGCGVTHHVLDGDGNLLDGYELVLEHDSFLPLFAAVSVLMIASLLVLLSSVRENKWREEREAVEKTLPVTLDPEEEAAAAGNAPMAPAVRKSMLFLLLSVAFWYIGYNAVTTAFSKYAILYWGLEGGGFALCLTIAMAGAIVSYIPIGALSEKLGRKKTILIGAGLLAAMFAVCMLYPTFHWSLYFFFVVVGFAWAAINVNSYPMVVEMSRGSNIGRYTGYYYTFSMAAQVITPILSGLLLDISYATLFPYAAGFVALSFVTMLFVRHGDVRRV